MNIKKQSNSIKASLDFNKSFIMADVRLHDFLDHAIEILDASMMDSSTPDYKAIGLYTGYCDFDNITEAEAKEIDLRDHEGCSIVKYNPTEIVELINAEILEVDRMKRLSINPYFCAKPIFTY